MSTPEHGGYHAHVRRAEALTNLGRAEQALQQARAAIGLDPGGYDGWLEAARALLDLGRPEEALEHVDKGIACRPRSVWAWRLRSFVLSRLGRHEEALAAVDHALSVQPGEAASLRRRARCLWALQRGDEALAQIHLAIAAEPDNAEGHGFLSDLCHARRMTEQGLAAARRAAELAPGLAWPLHCLGDALERAGQLEESAQAFLQAVRSDPAHPYGKRRLVVVVEELVGKAAPAFRALSTLAVVALLGGAAALSVLTESALICPGLILAALVHPVSLAVRQGQVKRRLDRRDPGIWKLYRQVKRAASAASKQAASSLR
ncbi:tetratricopeptide repeat protein [Myxococcota bacterium]|nr:tetratricopeptide repeat protein [Myxococcota bacterium]